jgi:hypothetical protein
MIEAVEVAEVVVAVEAPVGMVEVVVVTVRSKAFQRVWQA